MATTTAVGCSVLASNMRSRRNWTVKAEYDYLGLGNRTFVVPATAPFLAGDTFTSNNRNVQMVKIGVNYLFNWGAPATRY